MRRADDRLDNAAWLSRKRARGWSVTRLATLLGVDHKIVSAALRRAGLPVPIPLVRPYPQLHNPAWLTSALADHCVEDVARMVGCAPQSVRYAARKYGVPCPINGHDPPPDVAARLSDYDWLARRRTEGASIRWLAEELRIGPGRVAAAIHAAGLPPSAAQRITPVISRAVRRGLGAFPARQQEPQAGRRRAGLLERLRE